MSIQSLSRLSKENWFVTTTALFPRSSVCLQVILTSVQFIRFYPPSVFLQSTICFKYLKIISYRLRISQQINPFNSVA